MVNTIPNCFALYSGLSSKPRYDVYLGAIYIGKLVVDEDNEKDVFLMCNVHNTQFFKDLNCDYVFSSPYCEIYKVQI